MKSKSYIYQKEFGIISDKSGNEILNFLKNKITSEYNIHIEEIIVEPEQEYCKREYDETKKCYTCYFNISFTFMGTNQDGKKYFYKCVCNANYLLPEEDLKKAQADSSVHFDDEFCGVYSFTRDVDIETIKDSDISIENINYLPIGEILFSDYSDGYQIIYQIDDEYFCDAPLRFLKVEKEDEFEIASFTEYNGKLYIHPEFDFCEFELENTPYFPIEVTEEQIKMIRDKVQELRDNSDCYYGTEYIYYNELYRSDILLIYKHGIGYYMVKDPEIIRESKQYDDISDLLHVNNCMDTGISGDVKDITPAIYQCIYNECYCYSFEVDDDKKYIRSIGAENIRGSFPDEVGDCPANDMLLVNMKDGSQGYMFLNIPLKEYEQGKIDESKIYVKRAIYVSPKNNNK